MLKAMLSNWPALAGLAAASWAILTYLVTRRRELALRRTDHIFEQSQYLDNDKEMVECTLILYGKHPNHTVADFLKAARSEGREEVDTVLLMKFEKYLNFLWRICYAHLALRTLREKDMCAFGAYLRQIGQNRPLYDYCKSGFEENLGRGPYSEITKVIDNLRMCAPIETHPTAGPATP